MEERKKFDFSRFQLPKVSRWYFIRTAMYIFILIILGVLIYTQWRPKKPLPTEKELQQITISPSFSD